MLADSNRQYSGEELPKLRTACENCRQSKVKCRLSNEDTCIRCLRHGLQCRYGFANRSGKPKGSRNRATLKKLGQLREQQSSAFCVCDEGTFFHQNNGQCGSYHANQDDNNGYLELDRRITESPSYEGNTLDGSLDETVSATSPEYNPIPLSPTFLQREFTAKDENSYPLAVHIPPPPPPAQPNCTCIETQLYYLNQLNYMAADAIHLRLDQSLQTIKVALSSTRTFFHCHSCLKDMENLLLAVSILEMTLRILGHWIYYEMTPQSTTLQDERVHIHYGQYEMSDEESRRIRQFFIRGLLFQYREVLSMMRVTLDVCRLEMDDPVYRGYMGCEGTVEAFVRYMSVKECIC